LANNYDRPYACIACHNVSPLFFLCDVCCVSCNSCWSTTRSELSAVKIDVFRSVQRNTSSARWNSTSTSSTYLSYCSAAPVMFHRLALNHGYNHCAHLPHCLTVLCEKCQGRNQKFISGGTYEGVFLPSLPSLFFLSPGNSGGASYELSLPNLARAPKSY